MKDVEERMEREEEELAEAADAAREHPLGHQPPGTIARGIDQGFDMVDEETAGHS